MLSTQLIREKIQNSLMLRDTSKRTDDKAFVNPYAGEKSAILLETRAFNESPLNPDKCCKTLTKVLYLLTVGRKFTSQETTSIFFGITKLFQSKNDRLRRMIYLLIKYLNVSEAEVFIVTSSLTKDMNNANNDCYRANAIRVLSRIVDSSLAAQIDKYLKTAIVDRNQFVQSSALMYGLSLLKTAPDVVKKWSNEVSSALQSKHPIVQFHALALLYQLKCSDTLALQKIVTSLCANINKSPLAECLLIRYATRVLVDNHDTGGGKEAGGDLNTNPDKKNLMQYLMNQVKQTKHNNEMIMFEALRGICHLLIHESSINNNNQSNNNINTYNSSCGININTNVNVFATKTTYSGYEVTSIVQTIHVLLISPKSVVRFAVIRLLNKLSYYRPYLVSLCNEYMETLLVDSNRSIATLALIALLKTGHESNIDKFIKQINTFMNEISDACKIDIVKAVKQLCITYPSKYKMLMGFLSSNLREEGTFEFKNETVDALVFLCEDIPAAHEIGLLHLCEFIEDCEYPSLCTKILCFLGEQAPNSNCPSKFIRFIYNRLILENALIRASAVDALTKIAHKCPQLRKNIMTLIECCIEDNDDEVRDRANVYCNTLKLLEGGISLDKFMSSSSASLSDHIDLLSDGNYDDEYCASSSVSTDTPAAVVEELLNPNIKVSIDALCNEIQTRILTNNVDNIIDLSCLPTEEDVQAEKQAAILAASALISGNTASKPGVGGKHLSGAASSGIKGVLDGGFTNIKDKFSAGAGGSNRFLSDELTQKIQKIIPMEELGKLIHSCKSVQLTESEAEYGVQVIKHMYNDHVILQFAVTNTINDQILENVNVSIASVENIDGTVASGVSGIVKWQVIGSKEIESLAYDHQDCCYVVLKKLVKQNSVNVLTGVFQLCLKYTVKEDKDDVGYEDEYPLEQLVINISDYVLPRELRAGDFTQSWNTLEHEGVEVKTQFVLSFRTIDAAIEELIKCLNLCPCNNTDKVDSTKTSHQLLLSGVMNSVHTVLCKIKIVIDSKHGCVMQIICRSKLKDVCNCLIDAFD